MTSPINGSQKSAQDKLIEEVKLYWTIQVGVVGILGFLATQIDLAALAGAQSPLVALQMATTGAIAALLLNAGAVYNLEGVYYIRLAGRDAHGPREQEALVTAVLAGLYLVVSGAIGSLVAYALDAAHRLPVAPIADASPAAAVADMTLGNVGVGFAAGLALNLGIGWITALHLWKLANTSDKALETAGSDRAKLEFGAFIGYVWGIYSVATVGTVVLFIMVVST